MSEARERFYSFIVQNQISDVRELMDYANELEKENQELIENITDIGIEKIHLEQKNNTLEQYLRIEKEVSDETIKELEQQVKEKDSVIADLHELKSEKFRMLKKISELEQQNKELRELLDDSEQRRKDLMLSLRNVLDRKKNWSIRTRN